MKQRIDWNNILPELLVEKDVELKTISTIRIGGKCDFIVYPKNVAELKKVMLICNAQKEAWRIIGGVSNLLFCDKGFRGTLVSLKQFNKIKLVSDNLVNVGGGTMASFAIKFLSLQGFSGLEWAIMIPATIGGMVAMNAGAYGCEIKDFVVSVKTIINNKITILSKDECGFGYRDSIFKNKGYPVIEVCLKFQKKSQEEINEELKNNITKRISSQPSGFSCGSVFKKTAMGSAGFIIDRANCKGLRVKDAVVSDVHANFILNKNHAKCKDILKLMEKIYRKVYNNYKIKLEPEIIIVGEHNEDSWRLSHP